MYIIYRRFFHFDSFFSSVHRLNVKNLGVFHLQRLLDSVFSSEFRGDDWFSFRLNLAEMIY